MKKLLISLILLSSLSAIAQKIESEDIDKFNGVKTIKTTREAVVAAMGVPQVSIQGMIFTEKDKPDKAYTLYFITRATNTGSLKTDESSITLLMDDGLPMELKYNGKYDLFSPGDLLIIYSNVTKEQLDILASHKITDIRIRASYTYDYKVKEKKQDVISSISKLLLNN